MKQPSPIRPGPCRERDPDSRWSSHRETRCRTLPVAGRALAHRPALAAAPAPEVAPDALRALSGAWAHYNLNLGQNRQTASKYVLSTPRGRACRRRTAVGSAQIRGYAPRRRNGSRFRRANADRHHQLEPGTPRNTILPQPLALQVSSGGSQSKKLPAWRAAAWRAMPGARALWGGVRLRSGPAVAQRPAAAGPNDRR